MVMQIFRYVVIVSLTGHPQVSDIRGESSLSHHHGSRPRTQQGRKDCWLEMAKRLYALAKLE
jgi:hypothetical protein